MNPQTQIRGHEIFFGFQIVNLESLLSPAILHQGIHSYLKWIKNFPANAELRRNHRYKALKCVLLMVQDVFERGNIALLQVSEIEFNGLGHVNRGNYRRPGRLVKNRILGVRNQKGVDCRRCLSAFFRRLGKRFG